MNTTSEIQNGETPAPYLPITTFRSAVQSLRAHGLPEKLDRTAWPSQSGGAQNQIIGAFKFLSLIDDAGRTQPILRDLVSASENSSQEKPLLNSLLDKSYPKLFALNLKTATPKQVNEAMETYGVTGSTRDRAVRFFLKMAHHCEVDLSSRLTAGFRSRATTSVPKENDDSPARPSQTRARRRRRGGPTGEPSDSGEPNTGKAVKTITLHHTTGELTLSGTFNAFELDREERKLVYDIIDLMKQYEHKSETASDED